VQFNLRFSIQLKFRFSVQFNFQSSSRECHDDYFRQFWCIYF
jgi:hypothetical protein